MQFIYILTDGSYDDYKIIGVFSSEENADKAKADYIKEEPILHGDAVIEKWEVDRGII